MDYNLYNFVERLLLDNKIKESLNKTFKSSGIKVSYYYEYHEDMDLFFINGQEYTLFYVIRSKNKQ